MIAVYVYIKDTHRSVNLHCKVYVWCKVTLIKCKLCVYLCCCCVSLIDVNFHSKSVSLTVRLHKFYASTAGLLSVLLIFIAHLQLFSCLYLFLKTILRCWFVMNNFTAFKHLKKSVSWQMDLFFHDS